MTWKLTFAQIKQRRMSRFLAMSSFGLIIVGLLPLDNAHASPFNPENVHTVGICVGSSDESQPVETMLADMVSLEFLTRGYRIVRIDNNPTSNEEDVIVEAIKDTIARRQLPVDLIAIALGAWDSTKGYLRSQKSKNYFGGKMARFSLSITLVLTATHETILSTSATATGQIFEDKLIADRFFNEPGRMIIARALTNALRTVPNAVDGNIPPAKYRFPLVVYADDNFRALYGDQWKDIISTRVIFANDILKNLFDIQLYLHEAREWHATGNESLYAGLTNLRALTRDLKDVFVVAVTFDNTIRYSWNRLNTGLASWMENTAIVKEIPWWTSAGRWNTLENVFVLVHEIGHLFGAVHVLDERSLMNPYANQFTYTFDPGNTRIINQTKRGFLQASYEERTAAHIRPIMIYYSRISAKQSVILSELAMLRAVQLNQPLDGLDSSALRLSNIIPDSSLQLALEAYTAFKGGNLGNAEEGFLEALRQDPDFVQPHLYLGRIYEKLGKKDLQDLHERIAKEKGLTATIID